MAAKKKRTPTRRAKKAGASRSAARGKAASRKKTSTRKAGGATARKKTVPTEKSDRSTVGRKPQGTKTRQGSTGATRSKPPKGKKKLKKKRSGRKPVDLEVSIANDNGETLQLATGPELQDLAMRWRYSLSRRLRWKRNSHIAMRKAAYKDITALVTADEAKTVLGSASIVEVQVPYANERTAWEGRVAPWEFLISSTAAQVGNTGPLSIVRWLQTKLPPLPPPDAPKVLYVECSPGQLAGRYEFTSERESVERIFPDAVTRCLNPTIAELQGVIALHNPNIIHLAGIDNNQAKELLQDEGMLPQDWPEEREQDGIIFASEDPTDELGLVPIEAERLALALNAGVGPLQLVAANVYHSASRICALAVAEGAGLALGFQDTVRDSLAEILLRDFYTNWSTSHDPLAAFVGALDVARSSVSLSGTGIVLWSSQSMLEGADERIRGDRETRDASRQQLLMLDDDYSKWFTVHIRVRDRLNYSLLHNDSGGLFETLEFRKEKEGVLPDVGVHVELFLGSESHPYSATFSLTDYLTKVDDKIKVPLTSSIIRTVSEPMRTSLYVKVTVGNKVVRQETHRVTLLPADEWKDTDADRIWLPSFVLPRDPIIETIIDRAQRHLATLSDDHKRGFDGYQSIDPDDPESLAEIDLQVQSVWAAVVSDFGIQYINPPPSYTRLGQRLRTPTQIVRGGRGTCIDLALLLCACLEYVEIYPVIFLLEGHAFAGYWRSEDRYYEFKQGRQKGVDSETMRESIGATTEQAPWILPSDNYAEILNEVNSGFLYPLETVGFTTHGSFWEAIEEGVDNLRSRSEFHSLIDIWLARAEFITPLPIIDGVIATRGANSHD